MSLFFLNEAGEDSFGSAGDDIANSAESMGGGQEVATDDTSSTDGNQDDQTPQQDGQDDTQQDGSEDGGEDSFGSAGDDISSDADAMGSEDTSAGGTTPDASSGMGTENEVKLNPFIKLKYIKKLTHMKIILVDTIKLVSKMTEDEISDEIKLFIINSATSINEKISLLLSMKVNELEADNLEKIYIAFEGKVSIINDLLKTYRNKDDDKDKKKSSKSKKDKSDKEDEKDNKKDSKKSSK